MRLSLGVHAYKATSILQSGSRAFINYDDLYVTTLAARHGGCVLSGDKFKDILAQSTYRCQLCAMNIHWNVLEHPFLASFIQL